MGRRATIFWHAALSVAAGVLYFFFVLPRWPELTGETSHGLGTAVRIVAGLLVGLAALPVVFSLVQLRKPEFGTPALALTLRTWSVVAHVVAGVLIVGTAIAEIWLALDSVGQWLFGVYGAAAAVALLGIAAFYLSYVAEQPPPPPKPLKPKKEKRQRQRRGKKADAGTTENDATSDDADSDESGETEAESDEDTGQDAVEATAEAETAADTETATTAADDSPSSEATTESTVTAEEATAEEAVVEPTTTEATIEAGADDTVEDSADDSDDTESGGLRNRRPIGKGSHRRRRSRRGVPVDE